MTSKSRSHNRSLRVQPASQSLDRKRAVADEAEIDAIVATFDGHIRGRSDYPIRLIELAGVVAKRGHTVKALNLCRQAISMDPENPELEMYSRRVVSGLIDRYHVPMLFESRRNEAWDRALKAAIRPGAHALEIGTGFGMLALMAARAGATVTTCETDPVLALVAREVIERNGLAHRITVVNKSSTNLELGVDLAEPAEILFSDIFGDSLFDFDPLPVLADARRLVRPDATCLPKSGELRVALAHWAALASHTDCRESTAGFDFAPLSSFVGTFPVLIGDPSLTLLSADVKAFSFDFAAPSHPTRGETEVVLEMTGDGTVGGVAYWMSLSLDGYTSLDTRPRVGARYFMAPRFVPWPRPLSLRRDESRRIRVRHEGRRLTIWNAEPEPRARRP